MSKLTVQVDGKDVEVEVEGWTSPEDLAENFVPKAVHNSVLARHRTDLNSRPTVEALLADDEFKKSALTKWGIDPSGKAKLNPEQIQEIRTSVAKEYEPVVKRAEKAEAMVRKGLEKRKELAIVNTGRSKGIKDPYLTPDPTNRVPLVGMFRDHFAYSEEHDDFFVVQGTNEDGSPKFQFSTKPTDAVPFKRPAEFFDEWLKAPEVAKEFLKDVRQRVGGPSETPKGGSGEVGVLQNPSAMEFGQNLEDIASGKIRVE